MINTDILESISRKFNHIKAELDERGSRRWAACEALELGPGGIKAVAQATGLGERTIRRGCQEMQPEANPSSYAVRRIRSQGGGRKSLIEHDSNLITALEALVEPTARGGDPMSPLRGTCKSTRKLAKALTDQGHKISHTKVAQLLEDLDSSLQG